MTDDQRTKADLIEELDKVESRALTAESAAYRARAALNGSAPESVPEADALAACVRALDVLSNRKGQSTGYGYGGNYGLAYQGDHSVRSQTEIERVLRLLAAKYAVPLIEVRTEPCNRPHIENEAEERLLVALRLSDHIR